MLKLCIGMFLLSLGSTFVEAGGWSSGGGDVTILNDDTVILSDPYTQKHGEPAELNPLLKEEVRRAGRFLVRYGAEIQLPQSPFFYNQESKFVFEEIFNDLVEFRFVDELPPILACREQDEDYGETKTVRVACTQGPVTWIQKDLFARMNIREQSKTIIHESLHRLSADVPHEFIADITNAIELLLSLYNDQLNGLRPRLTDVQVNQIKTFMRRLEQSGLTKNRTAFHGEGYYRNLWRVMPNGGGLASVEARIADTAYVGVGSIATGGTRLEERAELIFTACYDINFEKDGLAHFLTCELERGASLKNLYFMGRSPYFNEGEKNIKQIHILLDENAKIEDSGIHVFKNQKQDTNRIILGKGAKILRSSLQFLDGIQLEADASIENFSLAGSGYSYSPFVYLLPGSTLKNYTGINFINSMARYSPDGKINEMPMLIVKPNATIDFENTEPCSELGGGYPLKIVGRTRVSSLEDIKKLCQYP